MRSVPNSPRSLSGRIPGRPASAASKSWTGSTLPPGEVAELGGGVRGIARGAFDQVVRVVLLPVAVDVLPQPTEERAELAALHRGQDSGPPCYGCLEELDREHVADGVGREVAEESDGP